MERKEGKLKKVRWKEEKLQNEERTFWTFFFFNYFAFQFSKPLKFVLGLPKWEFSTGKKHFRLGKKKQEKITLPPLKNIPLTSLPEKGKVKLRSNNI